MSERKDLACYVSHTAVIESHLEAAREAVSGLYAANPLSYGLPLFDDLTERIRDIEREVGRAGVSALGKLNN